jgi:hypothetical protein
MLASHIITEAALFLLSAPRQETWFVSPQMTAETVRLSKRNTTLAQWTVISMATTRPTAGPSHSIDPNFEALNHPSDMEFWAAAFPKHACEAGVALMLERSP